MGIERLKEEFKKYADKFDMKDTAIARKYYHSLRVMDISIQLARYLKFSLEDLEICSIIGILHDYARFTQWTQYKTYNDLDSIDHGDLAVELLFNKGDIVNFTTKEDYYDEIEDAIKYHNKYVIESDKMSVHNRKLCEVIRDADKLDIFYLLSIEKELLLEDNEFPTLEVAKDFYKNKSIDRRKVKNKTDNILLCLSMVFDLYYDYSYKYLKDKKLIEEIYKNIDNKEMFKDYFEYLEKYIDERVEKC